MVCESCGQAAQGKVCKPCEVAQAQRGRGTPGEIREREDGESE